MRGRKPKPTVLKLVTGNPGKRRLNLKEPKPPGALDDPPAHLSSGAQEAWRLAIRSAPPGLLRKLDGSILEIWACAADLYIKAQAGMAKTGLLIKAPNSGVPIQSPYLAIANKQAQIMMRAAAEMGFTPASRSRVSMTVDANEDLDPWESIAG
jgi:P27 family predicted phage terminase small subunit